MAEPAPAPPPPGAHRAPGADAHGQQGADDPIDAALHPLPLDDAPLRQPPAIARAGQRVAERIGTWGRTARHPMFWQGARDIGGVAIGLTAWSFMTGVAMVKSGMSLPEALAMTLLVFAGSAQLAAIPLIAAGAPLWVILITAFCVNLRFVVFSLHLRDYVMHLPTRQRLGLGYMTGDLTYVLFTRRFPRPPQTARQRRAQAAYLWGGNWLNWCSWQAVSLLGIFVGAAIPERWGLGFAGALGLLGLTCSLASTRLRALAAVVAAGAALLAYGLPLRLNIVVAVVVAVAVALALEPRCVDADTGRRPP